MSESHLSEEKLLQHAEGRLGPEESRNVEKHLATCSACSKNAEEIRDAGRWLRSIPVETLPEEAAGRIRSNLKQEWLTRSSKGRSEYYTIRWKWVAAAACLVAATIGGLLFFRGPGVELKHSSGTLSRFEQAARDYHLAHAAGRLQYDLAIADAAQAREWIRRQIGVHAELAIERPEGEAKRYRLRGVKAVSVQGVAAAMVAYDIDSHPVTLLTGDAGQMASSPEAAMVSKRIYYCTRDGLKYLTWNSSGQVYTLVSDLPDYGQQSCLICHTDPKRRKIIRELK